MKQRFFATPFALWLLFGACSNSPQEVQLEECPNDQVSVTVGGGSAPSFSWTPRCGMASLQVFPTDGGASLWVLYSGEQAVTNPFRSGIVYGQAPAGALEVTGPVPLSAGTEYTVLVYRWIGEPGGPGILSEAGAATFQR